MRGVVTRLRREDVYGPQVEKASLRVSGGAVHVCTLHKHLHVAGVQLQGGIQVRQSTRVVSLRRMHRTAQPQQRRLR